MANSTSTPEQSKNTAGPRSEPKPYIEPVPYEELMKANKNREIDAQSKEIIGREEGYVRRWRSASGAGRSQHNVRDTLAGLALSGGGIRSATFAVGVSQALAAKDKMRRFDYLSTVSGGGYFGSSLTWLTRADDQPASGCFRFGMDRDHFPYPVDPPGQQTHRRAHLAQDRQLIYLRQHGKYLAPGRGIDLVSGIAVVLRGFLLNLLVWLPIAALLLLVVLVVPPLDTFFPRLTFDDRSYQNGYQEIKGSEPFI